MFWIGATCAVLAGIATVLRIARRRAHVDRLGALSEQWIAQHHSQ
jgi:hypothetical protein